MIDKSLLTQAGVPAGLVDVVGQLVESAFERNRAERQRASNVAFAKFKLDIEKRSMSVARQERRKREDQ